MWTVGSGEDDKYAIYDAEGTRILVVDDGMGEAIRNRDRAEAIVDAMAFVKRYADHSAFYAAEATDILKRAGLR